MLLHFCEAPHDQDNCYTVPAATRHITIIPYLQLRPCPFPVSPVEWEAVRHVRWHVTGGTRRGVSHTMYEVVYRAAHLPGH